MKIKTKLTKMVETIPYDMIAVNIFLMSFFILLFLSSLSNKKKKKKKKKF